MIKYVAYCNTNGDIVRMAFGKASNNPAEGLDSETGQTIVHITTELGMSRDEFVRTRYWNGTAWTTRTIDQTKQPHGMEQLGHGLRRFSRLGSRRTK